MSDSFVHLHVHTEYSMLDGAARLDDLFAEAARMGQPALAMTDHGNVFGAHDFWSRAKQHGVKPIIGMEAYLAPGSRFDRKRVAVGQGLAAGPAGGDPDNPGEMYTHMTLLADSTAGMHNLFRLSSLASLEGYYYKPRLDRELLEQYGAGVIGTTGCASGEVNRLLQQDRYDAARQAAADYRDILGDGNFYCELMDHGLDIERRHREDLLRIARDLGLPLLATNDLHYTFPTDAEAHAVLLCVQTGKTLADPDRFKFDASDFYLKSAAEMRELWSAFPEACDNTLAVAERCEVTFTEGQDLMPRFPVPAGESEESWLVKEVERGLHHRFPDGPPEEHRQQAKYEVDVITTMGFPGYFLVVADLVRHAHEQGIRVGPGRGSAAGSMVAWALGITELDPIRHKLLFERFLNPERISMPDIDMDFDERRRADMIRYATEQYGEDHVAQIITYGTIKAKQAIKDSARVLFGQPGYAVADRITKALPPPVMGKDAPLSAVFDAEHRRYPEAAEVRTLYETDPQVTQILDTARGLENLKRQWGVHAAGVILSSEPLLDVIPIMRRDQDGAIITQFDMGACEKLGLLKMDFLGLRNLTVLDDCLANIVRNRGEQVVLEELELDDQPAYDLLAKAETLGVFQLDGGPMRALLRSMRPDSFEDISAVLALYRPGPMGANAHYDYADRKNGRKPIEPIHPELAEPLADILEDTYGLIVYQEQVMAIAQRVAGYTLGQADLLRRAMGKKKKAIIDAERVPFAAGMRERGYSDQAVQKLWDILVPFSDYAFNRSHTAGYGLVSYWTAYLKANYPAEYMAALLTSTKDDKDRLAVYLGECRHMGITVLPPDVNESEADFAPIGRDIRFGLTAVRNVGAAVVAGILAVRREKGRFVDFGDFLRKVEPSACNKKVVESLVKAGAFDSLGHTRWGLARVFEGAVDAVLDTKRAEAVGQFDLFGDLGAVAGDEPVAVFDPVVPAGEWDKSLLLQHERDMLGLYVSDHPLLGVEQLIAAKSDLPIASLLTDPPPDGTPLTLGGMLTGVQRRLNKQGAAWASAVLEDLAGSVELLVFPRTYQSCAMQLSEDAVVLVRGRVQRRDDAVRLVANEVATLDLTEPVRGPVVLTMPAARCTPPMVERLGQVLGSHPGRTEVHLHLRNGSRRQVLCLDARVTPTSALMADLKALVGSDAVSS